MIAPLPDGRPVNSRRFVPQAVRMRLRPVRARYVAWRRRRPPALGDLRRVTPIDPNWGFERGTPIDRYYLHHFFDSERALITGDVLEVQNSSYTRRYGRDLRRADTFDVVPQFSPTYLCDLAHSDGVLPSAAYDCVILPNTLQHLRELDRCLASLWRVVRPGGTILASAAGLIPLTADAPDYWRLSPAGWAEVLQREWAGSELSVVGHGNCLAAVAAQLGLALEELSDGELNAFDTRYPVLTTIRSRKPR